ncbi:MAG: hypothetical protein ACM3XM_20175 [Mycobacterium leprae]
MAGKKDSRQVWLVAASGVIAALVLIGVSLSAKPDTGKVVTPPAPASPVTWTEPADQKAMGNPAARVRLVEYGDYL